MARIFASARFRSSVILFGTVVLFALHLYRIQKNPYHFWAPAIDPKLFGSVALHFLENRGFRFDALEAYQLSEKTTSLDCYTFSFLHPFFIALSMKLLHDRSFFPILYSTALWMSLCLPLFYCVLRRLVPPWPALVGALLFCVSPDMLSLGPSGQSEPLMFVILFSALISFWYIKLPCLSSLVSGACLGFVNLTRPSGMILAPAFIYLHLKTRRSLGTFAFLGGFLVPTLFGNFLVHKVQLQYNRLAYPLVGSRPFGGPDEHRFSPEEKSLFSVVTRYPIPLLKKVIHSSIKMVRKPYLFLTDYWVFLPALLTLLWRRRSPWFGSTALAIVFSTASVVFYWYVPRVTLHLQPLLFTFAFLYLYWIRQSISFRSALVSLALSVPVAIILSQRISGDVKMIFESVVATILAMSLCGQYKFHTSFKRALPIVSLCLFLAIQARGLNSNIKALLRWQEPADLFPFQKAMERLGETDIPKDSIFFTEEMRNLAWHAGVRGFLLPENQCEIIKFLDRFPQGKYVIFLEKIDPDYEKQLAYCKLLPIPLNLPGLWVYGKPGL